MQRWLPFFTTRQLVVFTDNSTVLHSLLCRSMQVYQTAPDTVPETALDTAPDIAPKTKLEMAPNTTPEMMPKPTPEMALETALKTAPETTRNDKKPQMSDVARSHKDYPQHSA